MTAESVANAEARPHGVGGLVGNPFPGPGPYRVDQADVFIGREAQIEELTSLVLSTSAVLLHAESGFGKSSLLEAGLRPNLRELAVDVLPTVRLGRAEDSRADRRRGGGNPFVQLVRDTVNAGSNADTLSEVLKGPRLRVVFIDQFEELFLDPALWLERGAFLDELRHALDGDRKLRVVLVIRSDYLADLLVYDAQLPNRLLLRYGLASLDEENAQRVIGGAFEKTSVALTAADTELILDHLLRIAPTRPGDPAVRGQRVNLIQLQIVCRRLWADRTQRLGGATGNSVRAAPDLEASMRLFVDGAVAAAVVEAGLDEGALRQWLEGQLLTSGGRRAVLPLEHEAGGMPRDAVRALERARLVQVEQRNRSQWVELSHDSMVSGVLESNLAWSARHRRSYFLRLAGAALLLLGLLAPLPWLMSPDDTSYSSEGVTTPGGDLVLSTRSGDHDKVVVLDGDVSTRVGDGTAFEVHERSKGTDRKLGTIAIPQLGAPTHVFFAGAAQPNAIYEVLPGDRQTMFSALSLRTLPVAAELTTLSRDWQQVTLSTSAAALQIPKDSLVEIQLNSGFIEGGVPNLYEVASSIVTSTASGYLIVRSSQDAAMLKIRLFQGSSSLTAGSKSTVFIDPVAVVSLTGLADHLPAIISSSCEGPTSVEARDRYGLVEPLSVAEARQTRILLLGPNQEGERLVLTNAIPGTPQHCEITIDSVPAADVSPMGDLTIRLVAGSAAVSVRVAQDSVLLVTPPVGTTLTLQCQGDLVQQRSEGGQRLLRYVEAARPCTAFVDARNSPGAMALTGRVFPVTSGRATQ